MFISALLLSMQSVERLIIKRESSWTINGSVIELYSLRDGKGNSVYIALSNGIIYGVGQTELQALFSASSKWVSEYRENPGEDPFMHVMNEVTKESGGALTVVRHEISAELLASSVREDWDVTRKELEGLLADYGIPNKYNEFFTNVIKDLVRDRLREEGLSTEDWLVDALTKFYIRLAREMLYVGGARQ